MASVTQKIPSYVLGMSTQPDEKKIPGQVVDLVNGVPDVVRQLIKRPGSQLVNTLSPSTADNTKWFSIYTTDSEQYIGQCGADGAVKVWRCSDGVEIPVDYAKVAGTNKATYLDNTALSDEKSSDIQVNTINQTTFFVNRRKEVAMKTDAADKSPPQLNEAFISLDTISYGKQYALDFFEPNDNTTYTTQRATGLEIYTTAYSYTGTSNGDCKGMGRETVRLGTVTPAGGNYNNPLASGGTDKFSSSPPNMSANGSSRLRYEADVRCQPQPDSDHASDEALDDYHDSYQIFCKLQFGGEGFSTGYTHEHTTQKGITFKVIITSHVDITSRANICGVRPQATSSNAEEHVSAQGILGDIKSTIDSITGGHGITTTICGNGLHFYRATPFGVTSPEKQLMTVTTTEANNIADLPRVCRHGYTVRVVNSGEDMDDYYLRFQAEGVAADIIQRGTYTRTGQTVTVTSTGHGFDNGDQVILDYTGTGHASGDIPTDGFYTVANKTTDTFDVTDANTGTINASTSNTVTIHPVRFGEGVWEEVAAPGITTTFDDDTMPLKLVRVLPSTSGDASTYFSINGNAAQHHANGAFQFDYPDWGKRDVGDDVTNSPPSFVGNRIQKMLFFRNRIALLSEENVILSRVNDFYNFWVKTAMAISNADPIDLQSSSTFPTRLFDAVENSGGLVIFSASEQFLLSSGAEALLTPETAKITYVSSYAFNEDTNPVSLGTTIGFLNSTAREARFYEIANVSTRNEPDVEEQSKIIAELFPQKITNVTASTENNLLLFSVDSTLHTATNEVWGYKWYQAGEKRAQSAWFRWTLPNNVVFHSMMDDQYFVVLNTGSTYTLEKFDIKLTSGTPMIGIAPDENRVHLDTKKTIATGDLTYNSVTDVSTFTLGAGYYSSQTLTAYCTQAGNSAGKSYDISSSAITGTTPNETVTLPGNWKYYELDVESTDVNTTAETITLTDHVLSTGEAVTYQESFKYTVPTADVDTSTNIITINGHGLATGDIAFYNNGGGTTLAGLTNDTVYYAIKISDNTIKLATNTTNATAGTAITLTGTGNNAQTFSGTIGGLTDNTTYYVIKVDANTIKLATTANNATAGTAINLTSVGSGINKLQVPTDLIIGYEYEFEVELPKIYVTRQEGEASRSETRGSLVLHRMNFDFGDVGVLDVTLKRKGREDYTYTVESKEYDNINASTAAIASGYVHTIPVYDRNTNLSVFIKSNHPSPATLFSMNWEGDYSPRYYQRV